MEFGTRLRELRDARGMTQTELATAAGVSNTYISDVERNKRGTPTGEVAARLARALSTTSDYLLGLAEYPELPEEPISTDELLRRVSLGLRRSGATDRETQLILDYVRTLDRKQELEKQLKETMEKRQDLGPDKPNKQD